MKFDGAYREEVVLAGGQKVTLRLVQPEDKALLREGMERLTPRSRWLRFFTARSQLSAAEITYLTELDGVDHLAIGALHEADGVAIARFIRLEPGGEIAEPAIVVIDDLQGKGLGRVLLARLVEAARERGVTRFQAAVLAGNAAMLTLLRELGCSTEREDPQGFVAVDVPLPEPASPAAENLFLRILALAAQGAFCIRPRRG